MNSSQTLPFDQSHAKGLTSFPRARLFYTGAAALLLILMFLGFQPFYLHGKAFPNRELTPPIRTLLILHGTAMSAWMLLFLVQPLLIVSGNRRVHRMLGRVGAVLAAGIVILGLQLGVESARVNPPDLRLWGLAPKQFMAVPVISILLFAGFVFAGVWNWRRPAVHRPMMLLATLVVIPAAVDRIDAIQALYRGTMWGTYFGPFFSMLVIGLFFSRHETAADPIVGSVVCGGIRRAYRGQRADHAAGDDHGLGLSGECPAAMISNRRIELSRGQGKPDASANAVSAGWLSFIGKRPNPQQP